MTAIAINGATGRMGRTTALLLLEDPRFQLKCALTHQQSEHLGQDIGMLSGSSKLGVPVTTLSPDSLEEVDVIIDFSVPSGTEALLDTCVTQNLGLVSGTTGFSEQQLNKIERAANEIPILIAPNMSIGVNVSFRLIEQATTMLGSGVDIEVYEAHHRNKLDAPSGTAKRMGEIVTSVREQNFSDEATSAQSETLCERKPIEFHSARGGDVVGEHTVTFFGKGERLEITHRAASRTNFAAGAIQAALFIAQKLNQSAIGMYSMNEVLGLS
ncbi:MAG: 4-hydroxy-tetrahydrodipicolinate reductase [Gammaproteobacteria bacterium]|nr:4-hydroxy-tetrahydrodipicolinate reductase [Gammaproteobacteria bacterium]MYF03391.1 4-hydroxy-tetrahydrodipicolinate reductase [Gammaproteobacteria bacterium]MYI77420.1 4-hydroxy-tetrahydrodipicolinate reductase [Gammaproteobacteria bacterium]